jgi:hypothetical protein
MLQQLLGVSERNVAKGQQEREFRVALWNISFAAKKTAQELKWRFHNGTRRPIERGKTLGRSLRLP